MRRLEEETVWAAPESAERDRARDGNGPAAARGVGSMAILAAADRSAVERLMSGGDRPVRVLVLTGARGGNAEFAEVLEEIRQLAPSLSVQERPWSPEDEALAARAPAVVFLDGDGRPLGVRFSGYPLGYEFGAFVQDLADAVHGRTGLSAATLEALGGLKEPARIKVFTTPT